VCGISHPTIPAGRSDARRVVARVRLAAALAVAWLWLAGCADPNGPYAPEREPPAAVAVRWVGAYVPSGVWHDLQGLRALESQLGRSLDLAHWYASWDDAFDPEPLHAVLAGGRVPLISWQPMHQDLHDITAGHHDDYLRTWAQGIQNAPGTVYLRPFPEMNGNWVPWNGNPQALRDAWTHLTTLFANEGTHNVRWVWSPNVTDEPRTEHNRMENYYPGHDHVHVLALSGYNWGDTRPYIGWRSFEVERGGGRQGGVDPSDVRVRHGLPAARGHRLVQRGQGDRLAHRELGTRAAGVRRRAPRARAGRARTRHAGADRPCAARARGTAALTPRCAAVSARRASRPAA